MKRVQLTLFVLTLCIISILVTNYNKKIKLKSTLLKAYSNICATQLNKFDNKEKALSVDSAYIANRNSSYTKIVSKVAVKLADLKANYETPDSVLKRNALTDATNYLFKTLTDSNGVFDHWMGTTWDYNGITQQPLKDGIACGYFVSTPLKQLGFNLNRYKLAQQYSHSIVNSLCESKSVKIYSELGKVIERLNEKRNQIYIVGLDYHVGFLANIDGELYFIHSDYFNGKVVKEKINSSYGLESSNLFVVGNLLGSNPQLIHKWLSGHVINIVP